MFKNPKKQFKKKTLKTLQQRIWQAEINIVLQEEFQRYAGEKEALFTGQTETLEGEIAELKNSPKYEDRQIRKRLEEELKTAAENAKRQREEIDKSRQIIDTHIRLMQDINKQIEVIKERF